MVGKIDAYVDSVSPYSYYATLYLRRNRKALESYGIEIEFHPVFLGGINVGSGNSPPWNLPAKAAYSKFDMQRACTYFGVSSIQTPDFFPILSIMPQRCMIYIKRHYPRERFETTFILLWKGMYHQHIDISKPEKLAGLLGVEGYSDQEVKDIMAATSSVEYKQALIDNTQKAIDQGAFGAPWFWVRNEKGDEEPFFGSDRFAFMWQYLGVPHQDLAIIEKARL